MFDIGHRWKATKSKPTYQSAVVAPQNETCSSYFTTHVFGASPQQYGLLQVDTTLNLSARRNQVRSQTSTDYRRTFQK
jgi:hypothetical protein